MLERLKMWLVVGGLIVAALRMGARSHHVAVRHPGLAGLSALFFLVRASSLFFPISCA